MKAYGVPKIFGANSGHTGEGSSGGQVNYMRYDGSKVPTGVGAGGVGGGGSVAGSSNVSAGGFGGAGGSYGLYQQGSKYNGQKKF